MKELVETLSRNELFRSGHPLCPGCPGGIMMRWITKILGKNSICHVSATCVVLPMTVYPHTFEIPSFYMAMSTTAAAISGTSAALKILKRKRRLPESKKIHVFAVAGDGSAGDIGMASLSGAAERNDDGIFFCFDNEAYMNTGIQRSGTTPQFSWTTSTTTGKLERKKDLPRIMAAHDVPYVATVSLAFPEDFVRKLEKAKDMEPGFKYIHVNSPCPAGWRFPESKTIEIARLAIETGQWVLYEIDHGSFELNYRPEKRRPLEDYLNLQGRFGHLTNEEIQSLQKSIDEKWSAIDL